MMPSAVFSFIFSLTLSLCFLSAKVCARQDRYYWRAGASQPSRVTGTIFHVVFCLSRCISRFPDFTQATLYRKSLQFHVHFFSRMRKYIATIFSTPYAVLTGHTCTLQLAGLRVVGGKLALQGLYSCSLYYSWQLSV